MTEPRSASQQIIAEVGSWPGVDVGPGDRGSSVAFRVAGRELGHLHGDRAAHFGFPKRVWDELRAERRIIPHPIFPDARGPAARRIEDDADVREVIELLRLNYDRAMARRGSPDPA
jgi:hypothetical protein